MSVFPVDKLRPHAGRIGATIFKNDIAGVKEGLFWGARVEFEPLECNGDILECSLSANWMVLHIRDWRDLQGVVIEEDSDKLDASFYVYEHNEASWTRIAVGERQAYNFRVTIDMTVEMLDFGPNEADSHTAIHVDISIPYLGLVIDQAVVAGMAENESKAIEVANRYVDLNCYKGPQLRYGMWEFDPQS